MADQGFNKAGSTGIPHLINAMRFSSQGLKSAFIKESAFRQELMMLLLVLPSGAYFARSLGLFIALCCAGLFLLTIELLNSAIESTVDRVGLKQHELSKRAKDYGSAAVMLSLFIVALVWGYILYTGMMTA